MTSVVLANWNLEWAPPRGMRGKHIIRMLDDACLDILCLTEAFEEIAPPAGELITCSHGNRYADRVGGKKVMLWSRSGWSARIEASEDTLFASRTAAGIAPTPFGEIRVIGVCIPYAGSHHMATSKRWEDHLAYLDGLNAFLTADAAIPTVVVGDFNQAVPRRFQPKSVAEALTKVFCEKMSIATAELSDADGEPAIDHLACTRDLAFDLRCVLPRTASGQRLSDHFGFVGSLGKAYA